MPSKKNIEAVGNIKKAIEASNGLVFVDYRGITANQVAELRKEIRKNGAVMHVSKNNLIHIALEEMGREVEPKMFIDPTAVVYAHEDLPSVAKAINEASVKNEKIKIKGGYMESDILTPETVKKVANIPSREGLLSMLVAALEGPISNFVSTGQSIISELPYTLEAVKDKKSA